MCVDNDSEANIINSTTTNTNSSSESLSTSNSSLYTLSNVVLTSPTKGNKICNASVQFTWDEQVIVGGGITYTLVVSTLGNLDSPIINNTSLTVSSYSTTVLIAGNIKYYWRVRAITSQITGEWSDISYFTYGSTTPLEMAVLLTPVNNTTVCNSGTTFTWNAITGVSQYDLSITSDSDFQNVVFENTGIFGTSYTSNSSLASGIYYWRVRGINETCNGIFSEPYIIELVWLIQPVGLSPANNSYINTSQPTFTWNQVEYADKYHIQIATQSDFASGMLVDVSGVLTNTYYSSTVSFTAGTYYWRVQAVIGTCSSAYSNVYVFINP